MQLDSTDLSNMHTDSTSINIIPGKQKKLNVYILPVCVHIILLQNYLH